MWVKNLCGELINLGRYDGIGFANCVPRETPEGERLCVLEVRPDKHNGISCFIFEGTRKEAEHYLDKIQAKAR